MVPSRLHENRARANSFGGAARSYDQHRPRYPETLINELLSFGGHDVLDVGSGTGIAAQQFAQRDAAVLAVEPDARMAELAREKGIATEIATFEEWDPAGRAFDLVVFGASFHWVDPAIALPKVRTLLRERGRLALMWNRPVPTSPTSAEFEHVYRKFIDADAMPTKGGRGFVEQALSAAGFTTETRRYPNEMHYSREAWLDQVFTYSNVLTLAPGKAAALRTELEELIGSGGVSVGGDALLLLCTPVQSSES